MAQEKTGPRPHVDSYSGEDNAMHRTLRTPFAEKLLVHDGSTATPPVIGNPQLSHTKRTPGKQPGHRTNHSPAG